MTENKMTVRFYKKTAAQLAYLEKLWENKPMLIEKMPSTRNAFINMLLQDYLEIIIKNLDGNSKISYETLKKKLLTPKDTQLEQLKKNQFNLANRIDELYYLQMLKFKNSDKNTNVTDLESMFEFGSTEYKIHQALQQLVDEDNKRLFAKTKNQKG
jgi:hypothetical protein